MRKHTYIADPIRANARILAHSRLAGSGPDQYFYLHDRLGSVRQLKDCHCEERSDVAISSPSTTSRPTTPVFHTPNLSVGWQPQAQLGDGLERGQYLDAQTGEYYLRARQYNPILARFTARDPVFGKLEQPLTLHKYLYCGNDSVNRIACSRRLTDLVSGISTFSLTRSSDKRLVTNIKEAILFTNLLALTR